MCVCVYVYMYIYTYTVYMYIYASFSLQLASRCVRANQNVLRVTTGLTPYIYTV